MPLHYVAWKQALGECGCVFPEDVFYAWGGMPAAEIVATLSAQQGLALNAGARWPSARKLLYYELLPQLQAVPEVLEQIERIRGWQGAHSDGGGLGQHARFGYPVADDALGLLTASTRWLRGRLHAKQARPGAVPGCGAAARRRPQRLPRLRGHGDGYPGSDGGGHGFGEDTSAVGTSPSATKASARFRFLRRG